MPPDVDELTDEEQFDDDNLGTPVVSDVAGTLEIRMPDDNDNPIISDKKKENNSRKRFLILSGYHTLPSERDYWAEADDLGVTIVKNAMTRNFYLELKRLLHFQDNKLHQYNKNDKSFKIRPLLEMLSKNFQKWGIFHENLSVDEMIVRYYGHHTLKQFIKSKPIRFGYKIWALCGNDGYCYNFALYCGKETNTSESDKLPLGTKVVLDLLSIVEDPKSHRVYFDNFFTSHALLKKLKELKS
ncbi:piggyBac transposable element-derived protein 3-like [Stegodyphus dumicola]|uniref:piggyBac transposable element-derived protein 3-like n=1 Tax=Stegodyphus dumicola TaxID=202533 RepID=UPI0015ADE09D|nr:piggyBac transposable element-derived protein 3-like [Stegodyphus dumicola]